ncbi:helix-turn-helix domain-containing protein [Actinomycetaceae bacterium MB13-C1-2]|nr:helix-turn-helix domain-containing protein [Actinomycetaceae bacterium MB13-C1-2]
MRIAIYAFDGISMFQLASPLLVFGEVTRLGLAENWTTEVWTVDEQSVSTAEEVELGNLKRPSLPLQVDLLVFPSWPSDLPEPDERLVALIRNVHQEGGMIAGLCLGAFPVVASGILDGRSATTHWLHTQTLAARYPAVRVLPDPLYIDHGDVLTSAGTASALDACIHIVREKLGAEAAATIARRAVIAPHRDGGQSQYIDRPIPVQDADPLSATLDWALANLDQPLDVQALAEHAHMSVRNFTRRFTESTGTTPAHWVLLCRMDEARRLLETTNWSIDKLARACGFTSPVTFRQNFVKHYDTTPTSYRPRFTKLT